MGLEPTPRGHLPRPYLPVIAGTADGQLDEWGFQLKPTTKELAHGREKLINKRLKVFFHRLLFRVKDFAVVFVVAIVAQGEHAVFVE